jgi:hypothetical protein
MHRRFAPILLGLEAKAERRIDLIVTVAENVCFHHEEIADRSLYCESAAVDLRSYTFDRYARP